MMYKYSEINKLGFPMNWSVLEAEYGSLILSEGLEARRKPHRHPMISVPESSSMLAKSLERVEPINAVA
jgi:hypothetical protein